MRTSVAVLMCSTLVTACHRAVLVTPETMAPVLPGARIYYNDAPAFRDSVRKIVRDVTVWGQVWAQATSTQRPPPPLPLIDFGREMVVAVGAGRMNPGDEIHVDSVGVRGGFFEILVRTVEECQTFPTDVYPLEIVRVTWSDRPPNFVERRERAAHCQ